MYVQRERWGQTQENVLGAIILGNVKGLRQTLKARKFTVYSACQHLSTTGGGHLTTFLVLLIEPTY